ncbi:MAG: alkaline phosphatase [Chloroflexaceae bacterium]|jgi:alkaline phosphatase|nr:alkaline phosphatase [Chloroflexaceae bacterium]
MQFGTKVIVGGVALALAAAAVVPFSTASSRNGPDRVLNNRLGNVIFIHPDGTGASHWAAGRMYWDGPDANSHWDQLPEMAFYRGRMSDQLTGTSNGGATTHAFGYKVKGSGSFGRDGGGDTARPIKALSGYSGSILREAANAGHPVGVVNDGEASEPGTAAFVAETGGRGDTYEIVRQFLDGRPGYEGEAAPAVMLGGGEALFMPFDAPLCTTAITPDCYVHTDPITITGPERWDNRNLVKEAVEKGWVVIRTRQEFEALNARLQAEPTYAPTVLGLFAAGDLFNALPEEVLIRLDLVDPTIPADDKRGQLVLYGGKQGTPSYNPPTAAEMTAMALLILERRSAQAGKPFMLVTEVESTDNFGNSDNAIGLLHALKHANDVIGVARQYVAAQPRTLILVAADSDAGGVQVVSPPPVETATGKVTSINGNPTGVEAERVRVPVDGIMGRSTMPFISAPDSTGTSYPFAIAWVGTPDVSGGIVSRADGQNAGLLRTIFANRFDNTDVYRLMYLTLFGRVLPSSVGQSAPSR